MAAVTLRTVVTGRYVAGGKKGRGKSAAGRAYDALHYMQTRPLDNGERPEDRHFFEPEREGGSWREAREEIMEHATDRVAFHRLILSPGPDQPVADMREWTRMVMDDLSDTLGQQLHWVAVIHRNTDHPHAHVLIAGGGERDGELRPGLLYKGQYAMVRASGDRGAAHLRSLEREQATAVRQRISHEARQAERVSTRAGREGAEGAEGQDARESGITAAPPHGAGERHGGAETDAQKPDAGAHQRPGWDAQPASSATAGAIAARALAGMLRQKDGAVEGNDAAALEEKRGRGR